MKVSSRYVCRRCGRPVVEIPRRYGGGLECLDCDRDLGGVSRYLRDLAKGDAD